MIIIMQKEKIQSIELGRVVAIIAIVAMHGQPFLSYWLSDGTPWFGYIFNQATRFAVPLFFLISGYLIAPKLDANPIATLKAYSAPLLRIFVVWSVICLVMPFNLNVVMEQGYLADRMGYWQFLLSTPLNTLLEGGLVHLWFIPALVLAAAIAAGLAHISQSQWLIPLALLLYVYGVLAGSYQGVTDLWSPFFTRNGPFFSTLLFALGIVIRRQQWRVSSAQALTMAALGMLIHFAEAYGLSFYDQPFNTNDFLFGTALWGTGCFLWLLTKPSLGQGHWLTGLARYVLPVYVAHLPMMIVMFNIAGALELEGLMRDVSIFVGTLTLTCLLVKAVDGTKLNTWLFR